MSRIDKWSKKVAKDLEIKPFQDQNKELNVKPNPKIKDLKNTGDEFFTAPGKPKPRADFLLHKKVYKKA